MSENKPKGQPDIVIQAMREVVKGNYEHYDQRMTTMQIRLWQQDSEIKHLKETIEKLKAELKTDGDDT